MGADAMRRNSEQRARILARRDAVTGVPRRDTDGDAEAALMTALDFHGPTTQANWRWRMRALEAYGEAYDRASGAVGVVSRAEARAWSRWADPERAAAWRAQVTISDD